MDDERTHDHQNGSAPQPQLEEVMVEFLHAVEAGEDVDRAEMLDRHPHLAAELTRFFAHHDRIEGLVGPLRDAAARVLNVRCPHCHNPIELLDDSPLSSISCPSCGSAFSLLADEHVRRTKGGSTLGHFELLEQVGVGQFGSVWRARDTQLKRTVAVKIPRRHALDESQAELFLRDARAAAQLKHPNIVGVHEVGRQDGTIYIVSDFIEGATLKDWTANELLTPHEAAELCVKLAKALHHAHEAGVIHRDLKPGNIMLDAGGEPHVVDFGLAKHEAGEVTMTVEGQILGTPAYMPPEQARGEGYAVDCRADIYSLGVVLFELLTGELPFRGEKRMLIVQILEDDPPSPRKLNSSVPRDLETICLKCLEKEPAKRYAGGLELAHELERFLYGQPIHARPAGRWERCWRWAKRNPVVAALGTTSAALLLAVAVVTSSGYYRESVLHEQAVDLLGRAERGEQQAEDSLERLRKSYADLKAEQQRSASLAKDVGTLEVQQREIDEQLKNGQHRLYGVLIKLARNEWRAENVVRADQYLEECPTHLRQRDWHELKRLCRPAVREYGGRSCLAVSSDGKWLAAADGRSINVWEPASGKLVQSLSGHDSELIAVAFSPDGETLASYGRDRRLCIWNRAEGTLARTLEYQGPLAGMAFSPDGRLLAAGSASRKAPGVAGAGQVTLWETATWSVCRRLPGYGRVSFDGRSRYLAVRATADTQTEGGAVCVWDLSAPEGAPPEPILTAAANRWREVTGVLSPDGEKLAVAVPPPNAAGARDVIEIWDVASQQLQQRLPVNLHVGCLAFSPEGKRLACGAQNGFSGGASDEFSVIIWNLASGEKERLLPWYTDQVTDLAFTADGRSLATATERLVKVWDVAPSADPTVSIRASIARRQVRPLDWPEWGGSPARINTPPGENIPVDWDVGDEEWVSEGKRRVPNTAWESWENGQPPPGSRNIKWAVRLGSQTYGNPVVANGKIYVGTNNESAYLKRYPKDVDLGLLLCFEEQTGTFLWQHSNEKLPAGRVNDWPLQGVCSTPVVDGDRLWYVSNRGEVVCLDTDGFYDAEDDGPEQAAPLRLFSVSDMQYGHSLCEGLDEGHLNEPLLAMFNARGMPLSEPGMLTVEEAGKAWSLAAAVDDVARRFTLERRGGKLTVTSTITRHDKHEADVIWRFNMIEQLGVFPHNMSNCSMVMVDGLLFVCTSNGHDETHAKIPAPAAPSFIALDCDSGEVLWTDNSPGANILHAQWGSPSYGVFDGRPQVIFPGGDGWVYSFDPRGDGNGHSKLLWKFDANPKISKWVLNGRGTRNNIIAFPAIYDGLVYITVGQDPEHGEGLGHLWCIDPARRTDGSDVSAELAVDAQGNVLPHRRLQAVDAARGERAVANPRSAVVWHYGRYDVNGNGMIDAFEEEFHRSISIPVIKDDILYIADFSGLFHCLNAKTGDVYWTYDMWACCWGSPLLVDGKVFIGDEDGDIAVFRHSADPHIAMKQVVNDEGKTEWAPINEIYMGNSVYMTPIVANNVLYIATRSMLYAIEEGRHGPAPPDEAVPNP